MWWHGLSLKWVMIHSNLQDQLQHHVHGEKADEYQDGTLEGILEGLWRWMSQQWTAPPPTAMLLSPMTRPWKVVVCVWLWLQHFDINYVPCFEIIVNSLCQGLAFSQWHRI